MLDQVSKLMEPMILKYLEKLRYEEELRILVSRYCSITLITEHDPKSIIENFLKEHVAETYHEKFLNELIVRYVVFKSRHRLMTKKNDRV